MAESKIKIDPKNGYSPQTETYHSLRPAVPLPPPSQPLSIIQCAVALLRSTPAATAPPATSPTPYSSKKSLPSRPHSNPSFPKTTSLSSSPPPQSTVRFSCSTFRITGCWIHPSSGRSYHTKFAPPKVPGVDDVTGEPLIQRMDDTAAVLKSRLEAFHKQTKPVIDYYSKKGIIANLPAEKPPQEVTVEVKKALS